MCLDGNRCPQTSRKRIKRWSKGANGGIYSLFDELSQGKSLGMPISRPLPSIAKGLHELRLSGKAGEFRVFYLIKVGDAIYIVHACSKKKQAINKKITDLLKNRIRSINL